MSAEEEALSIWRRERSERLTVNLLAHRPAEFAANGPISHDLFAWAGDLAAGERRNVIITGPVGVGKTWTVWRAAERAVRAGFERSVIVTTGARLRRITAPATADPREFGRCMTAGLLALDDIASVRLSEWDLDHLAELADARWANRLPTIITSNVSRLRDLLGPRISSRLAHNALVIEMDGPDRRRQQ